MTDRLTSAWWWLTMLVSRDKRTRVLNEALRVAGHEIAVLSRQREALIAHVRDQHKVLKRTAERLLEAETENTTMRRMLAERERETAGEVVH